MSDEKTFGFMSLVKDDGSREYVKWTPVTSAAPEPAPAFCNAIAIKSVPDHDDLVDIVVLDNEGNEKGLRVSRIVFDMPPLRGCAYELLVQLDAVIEFGPKP